MVEKQIVHDFLDYDPDITITHEEDGISYFELFGSEYGIRYFKSNASQQFPSIFIVNYDKYDYPHIMTYEDNLNGNTCRNVCLFENNSIIKSLYSYEEKISITIDRLKSLLQLSKTEQEIEFQKEFLYYWALASNYKCMNVFLRQNRCFQRMNFYCSKVKESIKKSAKEQILCRFVSNGVRLNDTSDYKNVPNIEGVYIPITDNRGIIPPFKDKPWTMKDVLNIVEGFPFARISNETYEKLSTEKCNSHLFLVFDMIINEQIYNFGISIKFSNKTKGPILERLKTCVTEIELTSVKRWDYYFLNKQIGNDTSIIGKKVAVVGCGSLGSYIADDLVKAGIKNITLYDSDTLEPANLLRHKTVSFFNGLAKVISSGNMAEAIHPEIFIETKPDMSAELLKSDMDKYDLIIFTVGNSDVQLELNNIFKAEHYNKPVLYVWLEAGGTDSHILSIDYRKKGCFECLFTNEHGKLINNKANTLPDEVAESHTLRNGCGATRVAYGTSILLRTTSVVLDTVHEIFNNGINENTLINITPTQVISAGNSFIEGKCICCGDSNRREVREDASS